MNATSTWSPITSAPRGGELCLLFDETLERHPGLPRGRRARNDHMVVGRWHTPKQAGEKADWVTDIRNITFDGDQPLWEASPIAPSHWMPLPDAPLADAPLADAPLTGAWQDIRSPPLAYEYVLLCVPDLSPAREYPMRTEGPAGSMIVGCHGDAPHTDIVTWWSDLCEVGPLGQDPEDLGVELTRIAPAFWRQLPLPPG